MLQADKTTRRRTASNKTPNNFREIREFVRRAIITNHHNIYLSTDGQEYSIKIVYKAVLNWVQKFS